MPSTGQKDGQTTNNKNKMKTLFKVRIHSYVDLITNSSSELFICSTDKAVDVVKRVIEEIHRNWYDNIRDTRYDDTPTSELWTEIFREPVVANFTFDWYAFPDELKDEYLKYNSDNFNRDCNYFSSVKTGYEAEPEYKRLQKKDREEAKKIKAPYLEGYKDQSELWEKDEASYRIMEAEANETREKIWKKWAIKRSKSEIAMLEWYLKENGVTPEEMPAVTVNECKWGSVCSPGGLSDRILEMVNNFGDCESWGYNVKKGDILITTTSDNTAPYKIFGAIESMLNAERRHLG